LEAPIDKRIEVIAARLKEYGGTPFNLAMQQRLRANDPDGPDERALLWLGGKKFPLTREAKLSIGWKGTPVGIRTVGGVWVLSATEFEKPRHALVGASVPTGSRRPNTSSPATILRSTVAFWFGLGKAADTSGGAGP